MRLLSILALTAGLVAQSPLTTTFANNNGGSNGGAVYFDLTCTDPVGIQITDIDLNFQQAAGLAGNIDIYLAAPGTSGATAAGWALHSTSAVPATAGVGLPTAVNLSTPIDMASGCSFRVAIVCDAALAHAYTTATGIPVQYTTAELTLDGGQASNAPFNGALFDPRLVNTNIYYTAGVAGSCPAFASVESQGPGCLQGFGSIYELLDPTANDMVGQVISGTNAGTDYVIQVAPGVTEPVGNLAAPMSLNGILPDDGTATDPNGSGLEIGSNCWVATDASLGGGFTPDVAAFLATTGNVASAWTDLDPTDPLSNVDAEFDGTTLRVTYNSPVWGTTDLALVQIDYNTVSGDWVIRNEIMPTTAPEQQLLGWTVPTATNDGGPTDLSALAGSPLVIPTSDTLPLTLTATSGAPLQSSTPNAVNVTTDNIEAAAAIHVGWIGFSRPGISLGLLNPSIDPGCFLNASLDLILDTTVVAGGGTPSVNWTALTIPDIAVNNIVGTVFNLQSATIDLGILNGNTRTSNGLKYTVGNL